MEKHISNYLQHPSAFVNAKAYAQMYQQSITEPKLFWAEMARDLLHWHKPWDEVLQGDFQQLPVQWFSGAELNACYNCVDRHLEKHAHKTAIFWEGDEYNQSRSLSYEELHANICRLANVLKQQGIKKGDVVCIYLPMIPEAIIAMLACSRIGAIHSVVFAGFSAQALKQRILDSQSRLLITADESQRGGKQFALIDNVYEILAECPSVQATIVVKHAKQQIELKPNTFWYHDQINQVDVDCPITWMAATDPLFILYTSGST
ncbi:MAG: AMP-binding protein, partial [Pseudomonadota bacterium]